MSIADSKQVSF